uniref:Putative alcohol dehydrogenase n=1 Tax=Sphingomonas sp. KSM1 TaxID=1228049 RepID=M1V1X5_9SPHN|nr:putative alcohol dehydrogenase [Sphingomonas sp. KSM1]
MSDFDYIVVGAGSAGCVLANRLTENPCIKVLLLEEGTEGDSWLIRMPKGNGKTLVSPKYTAFCPTTHRSASGSEMWVRGKMLGGSGSINGMVWVRGQPEDFDHIASLGNSGWAWSDMAPYFKKLEDHALGESDLRGVNGPIKVTTHPSSKLGDAFINAGVGLGLKKKPDLNVLKQEGIGYLSMNMDRFGRRSSALHGFLKPARNRPNLKIVTGIRIDRLILQDRRVLGVSGLKDRQPIEYRTHGEVILSSGSLATPRILQLSGIGPGGHLTSCGVPVLLDSPSVGHNLREHFLLTLNYRLKSWTHSQNRCFAGIGLAKSVAEYFFLGRGPLCNSSYAAGAFVRSSSDVNRADGQLMFAPWARDGWPRMFGAYPGMNVFSYQLRPTSQGSVLIESADPSKPVRISPNYLSTQVDRDISVSLIRYLRKLMKCRPIADFVVGETQETVWAQSDDEVVKIFLERGMSGYHNCGTAAMGQGSCAVIDERLRVRGLDGLRVADMSIFPELLSGNTNAPTMAMAWRAADMFIEDRKGAAT